VESSGAAVGWCQARWWAARLTARRRELPPVTVDECRGPEAWCGGGGSKGPTKFGQEALGGGAH
jgi:hypothetical protein